MFIRGIRDLARRFEAHRVADPDLEEEEEEIQNEGVGGGVGDEPPPRGVPSRDEAARRVAERGERRKAEQARQAAEGRTAQELEGLRRFKQDAEPRLGLIDRLKDAIVGGGQKGQEEDRLPQRPDPYDPDYQAKMDAYEEARDRKNYRSWSQQARQEVEGDHQRRNEAARAQRREEANNRLAGTPQNGYSGTFFQDEARRDWPFEKREEVLRFAAENYRPRGQDGEFTQEQLERSERELYAEEVAARNEAKGANKIMRHLGAPPRNRARGTGNGAGQRSDAELDAQAEAWYLEEMRGLDYHTQVKNLGRLERRDPELYAYYEKILASAKDEDDDE